MTVTHVDNCRTATKDEQKLINSFLSHLRFPDRNGSSWGPDINGVKAKVEYDGYTMQVHIYIHDVEIIGLTGNLQLEDPIDMVVAQSAVSENILTFDVRPRTDDKWYWIWTIRPVG